jgi:hypothetical protein
VKGFLFCDPMNQQRRLVPVRLDDAEIPGQLNSFLHIDWRQRSSSAYDKLLAAVGRRASARLASRGIPNSNGRQKKVAETVCSFPPDNGGASFVSYETNLPFWDIESGDWIGLPKQIVSEIEPLRAERGDLTISSSSWQKTNSKSPAHANGRLLESSPPQEPAVKRFQLRLARFDSTPYGLVRWILIGSSSICSSLEN